MAYTVRKGSDDVMAALVLAHNAARESLADALNTFHKDVTSLTSGAGETLTTTAFTVTAADGAGTLGALKTLVIDLILKYNTHIADDHAHLAADTDNELTSSEDPVTLADCESRLNDLKAKYNAHIADTDFHVTADGTNTATAAAATDQNTSDTLANELKADFNAHIVSAPEGADVKLIPA